jgi:hypothetical protein
MENNKKPLIAIVGEPNTNLGIAIDTILSNEPNVEVVLIEEQRTTINPFFHSFAEPYLITMRDIDKEMQISLLTPIIDNTKLSHKSRGKFKPKYKSHRR